MFKLKFFIFSIIQHICLCTSKESREQALSISIFDDMHVVHFVYLNSCQNANILCVYAVLRATMHFLKKFLIRTATDASKFASALIFTPKWKNYIKSVLRLDCADKNYRIQKNRKKLSFLEIWVWDRVGLYLKFWHPQKAIMFVNLQYNENGAITYGHFV